LALIGLDIDFVRKLLENGEIVAIPTETVYGLAGNALNVDAIINIFKVKNRPFFDPLILHIGKKEDIEKYGTDIPAVILQLAERFWPGPLSLIVKKNEIIPDIVTSGLPTVAIRMPDNKLTLSLLNKISFPLAAPSANKFGRVSPTSPAHVNKQLGNEIQYILDGGQTKIGIESTIVKFHQNQLMILRKGAISAEEIAEATGIIPVMANEHSKVETAGQLNRHYATQTPIKIIDFHSFKKEYFVKNVCLLKFNAYSKEFPHEHQRILSPNSELTEAARNFFQFLHELDELKFDLILAELVPDKGIGKAINDRIRKAAATFEQ